MATQPPTSTPRLKYLLVHWGVNKLLVCHSERSEESQTTHLLGILRFEVASPRFATE